MNHRSLLAPRLYALLAACACIVACPKHEKGAPDEPGAPAELRSLGFSAVIEARHVMPGSNPLVEFVVFRAPGSSLCEKYHLGAECASDGNGDIIPWDVQEFLGIALVTVSGHPKVIDFRIVQEPPPLWTGGFVSEARATLAEPPRSSDRAKQDFISVDDVVDIDGDGEVEVIVTVSNSILLSDSDGGWVDGIARSRMLIIRQDLSLQLDTETGQSVYYLGEGGSLNDESDVAAEPYSRASDGSLTFRWCVIDPDQGRVCPRTVLCERPSHEAVLMYDTATDTYVPGQATKFERKTNLEDERCKQRTRGGEGEGEGDDEAAEEDEDLDEYWLKHMTRGEPG